jgi:type IV pilus assembly protein PilC
MQFTYEAKTSDGRTISGSVEASDEREAAGQLRAQGHYPMRLRPARVMALHAATLAPPNGQGQAAVQTAPAGVYQAPQTIPGQAAVTAYPGTLQTAPTDGLSTTPQPQAWYEPQSQTMPAGVNPVQWMWGRTYKQLFPGIHPFQLAATYRQFGALLGAGVPLNTTLDTIAAEASSAEMRRAVDAMRPVIRMGGTLSDAMRQTPWIFPSSHRAMIVPGEITGNIDVVFNRLADMVEAEHRLRLKLTHEMVQPVLTLGAFFLLPNLYLLVSGDVRAYLMSSIVPLLTCIAIVVGGWVATRLLSQVRVMWDTFVAGLPSVGKIIQMLTVARFCRMLGMLISGGVGVSAAINYASDACGNMYLAWKMRKVAGFVEAGYPIVDGFTAARVFPPLVISMMGTGEMTGKVDVMMQKVAEYYEAEADLAMHKAVQVFSALVLILIGIAVLILLIHMYTAYWQGLVNNADTGD